MAGRWRVWPEKAAAKIGQADRGWSFPDLTFAFGRMTSQSAVPVLAEAVPRDVWPGSFGHSVGPLAGMPSLPNDDAIIRLVGTLLPEQNDEWAVQRARDMTPKTIAPLDEDASSARPAGASRSSRPAPYITINACYTT